MLVKERTLISQETTTSFAFSNFYVAFMDRSENECSIESKTVIRAQVIRRRGRKKNSWASQMGKLGERLGLTGNVVQNRDACRRILRSANRARL